MSSRSQKCPNLIDGILLMAATAVGFALGRALTERRESNADTINIIVTNYAVSLAFMWTFTILGLNLTRYRATVRELSCRPGFTAMVAIVVLWTLQGDCAIMGNLL